MLVVIDLQPHFWGDCLDAADQQGAADAAARAAWLAAAVNPRLAAPPGFSL
ncbi:MAG TPA: hypothetical protein VGI05_15285 [Streptosporangiaceae bacterium]